MVDVVAAIRKMIVGIPGWSAPVYAGRVADQTAYPAVVLNVVASSSEETLGGDTGLITRLIQVDIWSRSYKEAASVSESIRTALAGFSGKVDVESQSIELQAILTSDAGRDAFSEDVNLFGRQLDFEVSFTE